MPRNRFVAADTVRLLLSDLDWIEIKGGLTWGERQRLTSAMLRTVKGERGDTEVGIDMARFSLLKLELWLVEWSLRDGRDKPVPLSRRAIENLDEETGQEIESAIDAYSAEQAAKKGSGGSPAVVTPPAPAPEPPSNPSPTTNGSTATALPRPSSA